MRVPGKKCELWTMVPSNLFFIPLFQYSIIPVVSGSEPEFNFWVIFFISKSPLFYESACDQANCQVALRRMKIIATSKSQGQVIYFHATDATEKTKKICVICVICGFYF